MRSLDDYYRSKGLPALPLRDLVVFPHMVVPLFVGREKSIAALEEAAASGKPLLLLTQRNPEENDPEPEGLYPVGTLGTVLQLLRLPDGSIKTLIEGRARVALRALTDDGRVLRGQCAELPAPEEDADEIARVARTVIQRLEVYAKVDEQCPQELLVAVRSMEQPDRLPDTIAAHLRLKIEDQVRLLQTPSVLERLELIYGMLEQRIEMIEVDRRIRSRVRTQMEKRQREYYLTEQMQAIRKELNQGEDAELERLRERVASCGLSREAREKAESELRRLELMPGMSPEATVVRTYIEWLVDLPWKRRSRTVRDLRRAEAVLERDHFGLEKVKERILEQLAVLQRVKKPRGSILCFVGPPGVGKTSLGRSIAEATNRRFVRISLGGVRDEAEIRGHRRTYIGALPGKVIQAMKKAGRRNPVILLDEIDKLGADFRGDPAAALLEVLDPEQNHAFNDHYLEVDFDLSEVLFITTANSMNIPYALRDRMEIIRISGYTEPEKVEIARRHLIPRQQQAHGLKPGECTIAPEVLPELIRHYTSEAGVRALNQVIGKLMRRAAWKLVRGDVQGSITITPDRLEEYLGVRKYRHGLAEKEDQVAVVTGLAWTEVGGELLQIETALTPGKGKLTVTGQLGDVMQESVQAAFTYVRARAAQLGLKQDFHQKVDIHVHVPEGAVPKDGPSAGLAMATSMVSALTGIPVRRNVCMTGEINLRGKALPIGGLKEKLLAAQRGGLEVALIPELNADELKEVPETVRKGLEVRLVSGMDEVLRHALVRLPQGFVRPAPSLPALLADLHEVAPTTH
ncbi:MAG: endopeptidase La [Zetaproteobacteria bacterium]|nr:MAG: endopeptidase La [Zetaproteobacteria bacterium]